MLNKEQGITNFDRNTNEQAVPCSIFPVPCSIFLPWLADFSSVQPPFSSAHQIQKFRTRQFLPVKCSTSKGFCKNQLISTASYCKKYGIMCCIVLKSTLYLCCERNKPVFSDHLVLKSIATDDPSPARPGTRTLVNKP